MHHTEFTPAERRTLAQIERDMDAGAQPFVVCDGERWTVDEGECRHLGISPGQSVSRKVIVALLHLSSRGLVELDAT